MVNKTRIIRRIISDAAVLGTGGIILLLFKLVGSPVRRGFFCNDESLMHPFHDSTVTSAMLYWIGFVLAIVLMVITEAVRIYCLESSYPNQRLETDQYGRLTILLRNSYLAFVPFCFGAVIEHVTTDIGKYGVGRLRPHFFSVCHLNMSAIDCSKGYIEDFECKGDDYQIREVRLSFPSGHSSFSMFAAVYIMIYLQKRMTFIFPSLIRPAIQMGVFSMAWFTCLSRISDYKHHWSDVLGGAVVGALSAIIVAYAVSDLFKADEQKGTKGRYVGNNKADSSLGGISVSETSAIDNQFREVTVM